jgi:hypothetical protein
MPDNQSRQSRVASWYVWAVGALAILWNGFGTVLWAGTNFMPDKFLNELPTAHRVYVGGLPTWSMLTWGLGVLGGLVGAILLVLRHRLAVPTFALSLLGAVTNTMVYVTNPPPDGFFNLQLTLFIIGFALFLCWFAQLMKRRGVL